MQARLKEWMRIVSRHFPTLSLPQVKGLATWSFGIAVTQSSSLTRVSEVIAQLNDEPNYRVRQRLKEWYQEADAKRGAKRRTLAVEPCFADLLRWVLELQAHGSTNLYLAMDASNIGARFTVLSIHVLYRGCAIPVAWKVVQGGAKGRWKPHWQSLFGHLKGVIPPHWFVLVCADRGLYADWLYQTIVQLGWHPFLRINHQGQWHALGTDTWQPLTTVVPQVGRSFQAQVRCFKENPLECTLVGRWDAGYQAPWLLVTDLPPQQADARWYGVRSWIECSYRDCKSDGWQWQRTRLQDPKRAERLWLAMAVAMLWMVTLGSQTDASQHPASSPTHRLPHHRPLSYFSLGLLSLLMTFIKGLPLTLSAWLPQPLSPPALVGSPSVISACYCKKTTLVSTLPPPAAPTG